jgi:hypothetical protein
MSSTLSSRLAVNNGPPKLIPRVRIEARGVRNIRTVAKILIYPSFYSLAKMLDQLKLGFQPWRAVEKVHQEPLHYPIDSYRKSNIRPQLLYCTF